MKKAIKIIGILITLSLSTAWLSQSTFAMEAQPLHHYIQNDFDLVYMIERISELTNKINSAVQAHPGDQNFLDLQNRINNVSINFENISSLGANIIAEQDTNANMLFCSCCYELDDIDVQLNNLTTQNDDYQPFVEHQSNNEINNATEYDIDISEIYNKVEKIKNEADLYVVLSNLINIINEISANTTENTTKKAPTFLEISKTVNKKIVEQIKTAIDNLEKSLQNQNEQTEKDFFQKYKRQIGYAKEDFGDYANDCNSTYDKKINNLSEKYINRMLDSDILNILKNSLELKNNSKRSTEIEQALKDLRDIIPSNMNLEEKCKAIYTIIIKTNPKNMSDTIAATYNEYKKELTNIKSNYFEKIKNGIKDIVTNIEEAKKELNKASDSLKAEKEKSSHNITNNEQTNQPQSTIKISNTIDPIEANSINQSCDNKVKTEENNFTKKVEDPEEIEYDEDPYIDTYIDDLKDMKKKLENEYQLDLKNTSNDTEKKTVEKKFNTEIKYYDFLIEIYQNFEKQRDQLFSSNLKISANLTEKKVLTCKQASKKTQQDDINKIYDICSKRLKKIYDNRSSELTQLYSNISGEMTDLHYKLLHSIEKNYDVLLDELKKNYDDKSAEIMDQYHKDVNKSIDSVKP